jgi:hypothetical protein
MGKYYRKREGLRVWHEDSYNEGHVLKPHTLDPPTVEEQESLRKFVSLCDEYDTKCKECGERGEEWSDEEHDAYESLYEQVTDMASEIAGIIRDICSELDEDCYNEEYYGEWESIWCEASNILSDCRG